MKKIESSIKNGAAPDGASFAEQGAGGSQDSWWEQHAACQQHQLLLLVLVSTDHRRQFSAWTSSSSSAAWFQRPLRLLKVHLVQQQQAHQPPLAAQPSNLSEQDLAAVQHLPGQRDNQQQPPQHSFLSSDKPQQGQQQQLSLPDEPTPAFQPEDGAADVRPKTAAPALLAAAAPAVTYCRWVDCCWLLWKACRLKQKQVCSKQNAPASPLATAAVATSSRQHSWLCGLLEDGCQVQLMPLVSQGQARRHVECWMAAAAQTCCIMCWKWDRRRCSSSWLHLAARLHNSLQR